MGGGTFGVGAASEFYFGKKVQDLDLAECAILAGLFKAPTKYAPHINLPAARLRANEVLTNMVQAGYMTEGQVVGARRHPAVPVERNEAASADYFLDWAFEQVKSHVDGKDKVLVARTTLDMRLQRAAEAAIESTLVESGEQYNVHQGALVSMEPDGAIRAMVGGRDYGVSTFNRAVNALRQPGSSFKPYVYATALETGKYDPDTIVVDAPVSIGNWSPQNYRALLQGAAHAARRAAPVAEHRGGAAVDRHRPAADRRSRRPHGRFDAAESHPLAAARLVGADGARPGDRLCSVSPMAAIAPCRAG